MESTLKRHSRPHQSSIGSPAGSAGGLPSSRRGQLWTTDLLMMVTLLFLVFLLFFVTWNTLSYRYNQHYIYTQLWSRTDNLADELVGTPGYPPSWERYSPGEEGSVQSLGVAYSSNHLSPIKLERLLNWTIGNYSAVRSRLGAAPYDFYIVVLDPGLNQTLYRTGLEPGENNTRVSITRLAMLNDTVVQFTVSLWQ